MQGCLPSAPQLARSWMPAELPAVHVCVMDKSLMYCGANKTHGITNSGKVPVLFYYYKWKV